MFGENANPMTDENEGSNKSPNSEDQSEDADSSSGYGMSFLIGVMIWLIFDSFWAGLIAAIVLAPAFAKKSGGSEEELTFRN